MNWSDFLTQIGPARYDGFSAFHTFAFRPLITPKDFVKLTWICTYGSYNSHHNGNVLYKMKEFFSFRLIRMNGNRAMGNKYEPQRMDNKYERCVCILWRITQKKTEIQGLWSSYRILYEKVRSNWKYVLSILKTSKQKFHPKKPIYRRVS